MNKKIIILLAGNHQEYMHYIRSLNLDQKIYIYGDERVKQYRVTDIQVVGTFWERKDANLLYKETQLRKF